MDGLPAHIVAEAFAALPGDWLLCGAGSGYYGYRLDLVDYDRAVSLHWSERTRTWHAVVNGHGGKGTGADSAAESLSLALAIACAALDEEAEAIAESRKALDALGDAISPSEQDSRG